MCIDDAEDMDGMKDFDGCPEFDADGDSIPDTLDHCPAEAEILNFINDTDGCPDTVSYFSPEKRKTLFTALNGVRFTADGSIHDSSRAALDTIAQILKETAGQRYLICWCDSIQNDTLGKSRSMSIADSLTARGISRDFLITPESGFNSLCSQPERNPFSNLHIKIIETVREFYSIANSGKKSNDVNSCTIKPDSAKPDSAVKPDSTVKLDSTVKPDSTVK